MDTGNIGYIDIIIIGLLVFFIIMYATGHGETVARWFSNNSTRDVYDEYDPEKLNRATLIFCIFLLADQLGMTFLGNTVPYWGLISIIITVAIFAGFIYYLRKFAQKK